MRIPEDILSKGFIAIKRLPVYIRIYLRIALQCWNISNLMSLTSWCCANALWILNFQLGFMCNKSSIKTCKDFAKEIFRLCYVKQFSVLVFVDSFLWLLFFIVMCIFSQIKKRKERKPFDVFVCEFNFLWLHFFPVFGVRVRRRN